MKIILPENQSEVTLGQYQDFMKLQERTDLDGYEMSKRKLKIFTGLNYQQISQIKIDDLVDMVQIIDKALAEEAEFKQTFKMHDMEFGFIPNFDDIKSKEYFDLSTYSTEISTLHNLMAILYRPISEKVGSQYKIVDYTGSKGWAEAMKKTPLSIVNGSLVFFYSLAMELQSYILKYIPKDQASQRLLNISKSGDGFQRLTDLQKESSGDTNL